MKDKIITSIFRYCVVNLHDDVLCLFRFSESARDYAELLNKTYGLSETGVVQFNVKMTQNFYK